MTYTIYHNPKCSKSRAALELLSSKGITPNIIEYLKTPPTEQELNSLVKILETDPKNLIRMNEDLFKELKPDINTSEDVVKLLLEHPRLLERPVIRTENRAVIGRPTENIEKLFE